MRIKDLIGEKIIDIFNDVKFYEKSENIALEYSETIIVLENGVKFEIPYMWEDETDDELDDELILRETLDEKEIKSIFSPSESNFIQKLFGVKSIDDSLVVNVKDNKIVGILKSKESGYIHSDKYFLELESGYLISEITMNPIGTGYAGLHVYKSKEELCKRFNSDFVKIV